MKTKTISGVTLYRRPASSACPRGAWFSERHHTDYGNGGWRVYETGIGQIAICCTAREAQEMIARIEAEIANKRV
jgi:hypothetical protein